MVNNSKKDFAPHKMSSTDLLQSNALQYELDQFKMKPTFEIGDNHIRDFLEKRIEEYYNGKKV